MHVCFDTKYVSLFRCSKIIYDNYKTNSKKIFKHFKENYKRTVIDETFSVNNEHKINN